MKVWQHSFMVGALRAAFLAALAQVTRADPVKGGLELAGPARRMIFDAAR